MYQRDVLLILATISLRRFFLLSSAYRLAHDSASMQEDIIYPLIQKKSLDLPVPEHEHVCPLTILKRHQPYFGHMENGSYVEIQQDSEHSFVTTFVECTDGHHRPPCHGIDHITYSSECVTLYEWRSAYVRLPRSGADFISSKIKIPIACQCRLTRNLQPLGRLFGIHF